MIGSGSPGSAQTQQRRVSGLSGSRKASLRAARGGARSAMAMPTLAEAETSDSEDADEEVREDPDPEARAQEQAKLRLFDTQRDRLHAKVGGGASSELMAKLARRRDSTRKLYDTLTV